MASSQVEIATSSPFGCAAVHNRRDPCFQNNLIDLTDLWVHRPQWQSNDSDNNNTHKSTHQHSNKWAKAREMVLSVDHRPTRGHDGGHSRKPSFEVSDLGGVSSLVQKWKGFEATRSPNNNGSCKNNNNDNNNSNSNTSQDNIDPPTPTPTIVPSINEDDSLGDWESDRTAVSGPPSSRSRDSDTTDMERLRVADIIRKWKDNVGCCDSLPPRVKTATSSEQRCLPPVVNSPRIRGRQAFNDLLMQIKRNRNDELQGLVERKPVSNFSHRGRIQSMLRYRFLNRGMEAQSEKAIQPHVTRTRERVNASAQKGSIRSECCQKELTDNNDTCATQNACAANKQGNENRCDEVNSSSTSRPEIRTNTIQDSEVPITPRQQDVGQSCHKVNKDTQKINGRLSHRYESLGHEKNPFSTLIRRSHNNLSQLAATSAETDTSLRNTETNSRGITESPCTSVCHKEEEDVDANHDPVMKSNYDPIRECEDPSSYHEDELASSQDLVDTTSMYWVSDGCVSNPEVEWEELQSDDQEGNNREWIDEVSRPCSDWENLRQARYKEMLDPFSENEEIRVLLGRRSVSTFLSSNLRDKIDQVMASRVKGPQTPKNGRILEEKHEIRLPEQAAVIPDKQEEEEGEYEQDEGLEDYNDNFDEYEEAENSVSQQQYNESDDYTDQITMSSPPESWPQNQSGSDDYSYLAASPSTQQSPSNYYSQNSRPNSSHSARPSPAIDMELIYELRGHMQQLHQEMSELRKSIKYCVDMQIELRRSIKKEVATALQHSEAKNYGRRNAVKKFTSTGGKCCVCCKMQVDTLLYRCGHMCTCFKCAHKLHWSSGKCPICRAPILDVVRTYSNHS